jgi:two-component system nitrogen regulation response regulator NtrX
VRELRNVVERMAILTPGDQISTQSLPPDLRASEERPPSDLQDVRNSAERDRILRALDETNWDVSGASRSLGVERTNLHKRIRALGLARDR